MKINIQQNSDLSLDYIELQSLFASLPIQVHTFAEVGSTNDMLSELLNHSPLDQWHLCISKRQTAGRGQRGRIWDSNHEGNWYFSIGKKYLIKGLKQHDQVMRHLTLLVAYNIANFLNNKRVPAQVKWPNDIYLDDAKLGGVLIQQSMPGLIENHYVNTTSKLVVGIGLNIHQKPADLDQKKVACVNEFLQQSSQGSYISSFNESCFVDLCMSLTSDIEKPYERLLSKYNPRFLGQYDYLKSKKIAFMYKNRLMTGYVLGISSEGELRLSCQDSKDSPLTQQYQMGEIQIKQILPNLI